MSFLLVDSDGLQIAREAERIVVRDGSFTSRSTCRARSTA